MQIVADEAEALARGPLCFRGREVDRITCGDGNDNELLDTVDVITGATAENPNGSCARLVRKAPKSRDSRSENYQQARVCLEPWSRWARLVGVVVARPRPP